MNKRHMPFGGMESSVDMARALMLISQHGFSFGAGAAAPAARFLSVHARVFECKTCNRQFSTFQALGGHRASHKRPRLRALGDVDGDGAGLCLGLQPPQKPPRAAGPRVHECPVCGRRFAVGQALGGHMRRHRAEGDADAHDAAVGAAKAGEIGGICLDLNLTPSENCAKCRSVHKAVAILDSSL